MDVNSGALADVKSETISPVVEHSVNEKHTIAADDNDDYRSEEVDVILPTHEELHGPNRLKRISAPIPWAVYTVAFVELCERFSYYGTSVVCECLPNRRPHTQNLTTSRQQLYQSSSADWCCSRLSP